MFLLCIRGFFVKSKYLAFVCISFQHYNILSNTSYDFNWIPLTWLNWGKIYRSRFQIVYWRKNYNQIQIFANAKEIPFKIKFEKSLCCIFFMTDDRQLIWLDFHHKNEKFWWIIKHDSNIFYPFRWLCMNDSIFCKNIIKIRSYQIKAKKSTYKI